MPSRYLEASSSFLFDQKCRGEDLPECIFPPAQPPDPVGGENIYIGSIFSSLAKMYLDRNVSTLLLRYMEALLNLGKNDEILRSWKQGQLLKTFCHLSFSTWLVVMMTKMTKRPELVAELGGNALWGLGRIGGLDCSYAPDRNHHFFYILWKDSGWQRPLSELACRTALELESSASYIQSRSNAPRKLLNLERFIFERLFDIKTS